jgi:propanediol dehydratase large subunit
MKELNPNQDQDKQLEAVRRAVDAVFAEIGLKFPRDDFNEGLVRPELSTADRPKPTLQIVTQTGIEAMKKAGSHLQLAELMVEEAFRDVSGFNLNLDNLDDDIDRQFALAE